MRNVSLRFVPHGKFTWKLYSHSLLFLHRSFHSPPSSQHFKECLWMFSGFRVCLLSHCVRNREATAKKEVEANSKRKPALGVDHVDLWVSAVSEAFWDATEGFNSTHLDLNYTLMAAHLGFSMEAPSFWWCPIGFIKDEKKRQVTYVTGHQIPRYTQTLIAQEYHTEHVWTGNSRI